MWHYPDSSGKELLELVSPFLLSNLLGIGIHQPLIVEVQSFNADVWNLGHHCPQLNVARPLIQMDRQQREIPSQ